MSATATPPPPETTRALRSLHRLIGNTPLLVIHVRFRGQSRRIFAKCESLNLTGSIKDRMALYVLEQAYRDGSIEPGAPIAEATSGNTGIAFAAVGRALGHPVTIFMPDWMSEERISLIASFGSSIVLVSRTDGGFLGSIERAEAMAAADPRVFLPRQFSNEANVAAHAETTGPEIVAQLATQALAPDAFVAGVGTGGTVMGVARAFSAAGHKVRVHPLEPAESPTLSTGHKVGAHRIQGISDEFIPPIVHLDQLAPVVSVHDGDAILMAQALAARGLAVGISSGANLVGALQVQDQLGGDATVVTVFADSNKKYLSTDLLRPERSQPGYLSAETEIEGFEAISRTCMYCAR
ncbi:MAG: PLP-dependent cysteine synthase family protein [Vicinamibacterales bacterium]